jgi:hypothetical protein
MVFICKQYVIKRILAMNTLQRKAEAAANHKANLSALVKRRMEVARANNDAGLLNVLEQEMKQLGLN